MPFWTNPVYGRFDTGVEQLDNHDENDCAGQQYRLNPAAAQPEGGRDQQQRSQCFLAKSRFMPTSAQARNRIAQGMPDTTQALAVLLRINGLDG